MISRKIRLGRDDGYGNIAICSVLSATQRAFTVSLTGQKHRVSMSVFVPQQLLKDYCQWTKTDV